MTLTGTRIPERNEDHRSTGKRTHDHPEQPCSNSGKVEARPKVHLLMADPSWLRPQRGIAVGHKEEQSPATRCSREEPQTRSAQ